MTDGLSIGGSQSKQAGALRTYKLVLGFNMLLHVFVGVACMAAPDFVANTTGLPTPPSVEWMRGWGATLILVTALYMPGLQDPIHTRAPNIIGILGRIASATVWLSCGGGFVWFAVFDYVWGFLIAFLYLRLFRAVIMTRP